MDSGQQDSLADLRLRIARLEGGSHKTKRLPFGLTDVDGYLPGGGLARGALTR
jgi:protein ImuA